MMDNKPIKCAANGYPSDAFYLIQTNGSDQRFIASFREKEPLKRFFEAFINSAANSLQVKIRDFADSTDGVDYVGEVDKDQLLLALEQFEDTIFHSGFHDFMVMVPESGNYFVLDDHGLLFIYSHDDFSAYLEKLGAKFRPDEQLMYQYNHWHFSVPNGKAELKKLIATLALAEDTEQ